MQQKQTWALIALLMFLLFAAALRASEGADTSSDAIVITNEGFLQAHPDILHRARGLAAYEHGKYADALEELRTSARYADKPSQFVLGSMIWNGLGCPEDHAKGYAWMSIAAERGYPQAVKMREIYWQSLNRSERNQAQDEVNKLQLEYSDAVAKPRLNTELRVALDKGMGKHPALKNDAHVIEKTPDGAFHVSPGGGIPGTVYYADRYWKPAEYWNWQDEQWRMLIEGHVEVLPPKTLPKAEK